MNFRRGINTCYTFIILLWLCGCTSTNPLVLHTIDKPSLMLEQQILARVSDANEVIDELRTPEGFFAIATTLPEAVSMQMKSKKSWQHGCPVGLNELSYIVLTHWGFDDQVKVGELVVHRKLTLQVMTSFAELFASHYPIEKMELIEKYDSNDDRSMAANNSSAFNCRDITGKPGVFSTHSYGGAIDINPIQNPFVAPKSESLKKMGWDNIENKGEFLRRNGYNAPSPALTFCTERPADCIVVPKIAAEFVDRTSNNPLYLQPHSNAVNAFTDQGFEWGGNWSSLVDYQHFEYDRSKLLSN